MGSSGYNSGSWLFSMIPEAVVILIPIHGCGYIMTIMAGVSMLYDGVVGIRGDVV